MNYTNYLDGKIRSLEYFRRYYLDYNTKLMNVLEWLKGLFGGKKEETGSAESASEQSASEQPASGEQSESSNEQPQQ